MSANQSRNSLTDEFLAQMVARINYGKLQPGAQLPTQSELVQRHGVSRTVVREALQRLQATGWITTRHGIGSFVCEHSRKTNVQINPLRPGTVMDTMAILELRFGLETEAASLAAIRRTRQDLDNMEEAMKEFAQQMTGSGDAVNPDLRFHLAIMNATRNHYFADILSSIGNSAIPRSKVRVQETGTSLADYLRRVNDEHEDIYRAILREDADAARAAIRNHLSNGRERMRRTMGLMIGQGEHAR